MVVIRLARGGDKKNPFYRIVVTDKRNRRDGRYIEQVGFYDPMARGQATPLQLDMERMNYWHGVGAKCSERVTSILNALKRGEQFTAGKTIAEHKKEQASSADALHQKKREEEKKAALAAQAAADKEKAAAAKVEEDKIKAEKAAAEQSAEPTKDKADKAEQTAVADDKPADKKEQAAVTDDKPAEQS